MSEKPKRFGVQNSDVAWMAIGLILGGSLRLLGASILAVILLAGMGIAYALGWRVIVTRRNKGQTIDV